MRKNVAGQNVGAQLVSATDGSAFTGAVTVSVTGDAGTQATGSVGAGACTHEGNGYHTYAPAQAETNYNLVAFTFTGTGAVPVTVQVYTTSLNPHDTVRAGMTALPNAAADAAGGLIVSDAGGLDADAMRSDVAAILVDTGTTLQAELDGIQADTEDIQTRLPAALGANGNIKADVRDWLGTAAATPTTAGIPDVNVFHVYGNETAASELFALMVEYAGGTITTNIAGNLSGSVGSVTGAVGSVTGAVGSVTGNVGGNVAGSVGSVTGAVGSVTGNVGGNVAGSVASVTGAINTAAGTITTLDALDTAQDTQHGTTQTAVADVPTNAELATAIITGLTTALTEGYRATGATGSVRDMLYELLAHMGESSIAGTTKTLKKLDAATTAKTYTLNDATTPTAITESS
jgi:hypothetical protein